MFSGSNALTGVTEIPGTLMLWAPDANASLREVAVIVTIKSPVGGVVGGAYVTAAPLGEVVGKTVPQSATEQTNDQVTPLLAESLVTVAVNWAVVPTGTMTGTRAVPLGATETDIGGGGVMVNVNRADLAGSAPAVAVTVAVTLLATLAGASYSTDVPVCLLRAPGPVSFQVTPFPDESFVTIAVMVAD